MREYILKSVSNITIVIRDKDFKVDIFATVSGTNCHTRTDPNVYSFSMIEEYIGRGGSDWGEVQRLINLGPHIIIDTN